MDYNFYEKGGTHMSLGIRTGSGETVSVIVPTRYYAWRTDDIKYPLTSVPDFLSDAGFAGADLSLELIAGLEEFDNDDGWRSVVYRFGNRAAARGLSLPMCHLPFYMPDPGNTPAMTNFIRTLRAGIRAAAMLGIPDAVIHPIVRHSSRRCRDEWFRENLEFLSPLREQAGRLGVRLCIENMVGRPYADFPDETVYGCRAAEIMELAERLDTGVCWDFGHANLSGLCQSVELEKLRGRLRCLHIHDNDGMHDAHLIPGDHPSKDSVDWDDAAEGLRLADFFTTGNRCLDMELKTSDLPDNRSLRLSHASRTIDAAKRFAGKI